MFPKRFQAFRQMTVDGFADESAVARAGMRRTITVAPEWAVFLLICLLMVAILGMGNSIAIPLSAQSQAASGAGSAGEGLPAVLPLGANDGDDSIDFVAGSLEVTQAVQDLDNSVRLVQDKRTFVRFHARVNEGVQPADATLRVERGDESMWLLPLNAGQVDLRTDPDRGVANQSFLFELPDGFKMGSVTLTAQVMPGQGAGPELDKSNNSTSVTVTFEPVPPVNLVVYRLGYRLDGADYWASTADQAQLVDWLRRAYPLNDLRVWDRTLWLGDATVDEKGVLTSPTCGTVNATLASKKLWDVAYGSSQVPGDAHYYGLVDDGGGFMGGCALGSPYFVASGPTGQASWGWDVDGSYGDWYGGFGLGLTYGQDHAGFCGTSGRANYPYPNGRISPSIAGRDALYGFDIGTQAIYSPGYKDLMTQCGLLWMSDYTYEGLMDFFQANPVAKAATDMAARQDVDEMDRLLITGAIDPTNMAVRLNPFFVMPGVGDLAPSQPGPFTIVLKNGDGATLARYPFTPQAAESGLLTDTDGATPPPAQAEPGSPWIITELVPFAPGTVAVEILVPDSASITGVTANPGMPNVQILAPAAGAVIAGPKVSVNWTGVDEDGDALIYNVQYSADGGQTWEMVAQGVRGNSVEIDTSNLAANLVPGQDAQFRVWATDGIHTTFADSHGFTLPNRAPTVAMPMPSRTTVAASQTINLSTDGYDVDSGPLSATDLIWTSNLDGSLGTGRNLSLAGLSVGTHTIAVSAQDAQGGADEQTIQVNVVSRAGELPPPADKFQAGPSLLSLEMQKTGFSYISLSNINPARSVNWTAVPDQEWIKLGKTSGTTPDIIPVSVNWTSVNWTSVNWTSVNWTSVNWTSVNWTSVNWTSVNWTSVNWTDGTPQGTILGSITLTSPDLATTISLPVEAIIDPLQLYLPVVE